jgi:hypothetical protein
MPFGTSFGVLIPHYCPPNAALQPRRARSSDLSQDDTRAVGCKRLLGGELDVTLISMTIKARVRAGRLVFDEPTALPEGTEVELLPLDPGDWLDDAGRAALHAALTQSQADVTAGRLTDAADVLKQLRSR